MAKHLKDTEPGDRRKVGELIRAIRVAFLTTVDHDGRFHARPVQTLQVDADETLWFFTDWSSPKVGELHRDVRVSLGYADPAKNIYVAIGGVGTLLRDPRKASELWSVEQRAYYPQGPEDERLALLRSGSLRTGAPGQRRLTGCGLTPSSGVERSAFGARGWRTASVGWAPLRSPGASPLRASRHYERGRGVMRCEIGAG